VTPPDDVAHARSLLASMAIYRENEDLIQIGAYQPGSSPEIDRAIALRPGWQTYLQQTREEASDLEATRVGLRELVGA